jgi:hypothetical protein
MFFILSTLLITTAFLVLGYLPLDSRRARNDPLVCEWLPKLSCNLALRRFSFRRSVDGLGCVDARTRESEDDRRSRTDGNRLSERGVRSAGKSRAASRWIRSENGPRPRGFSLK